MSGFMDFFSATRQQPAQAPAASPAPNVNTNQPGNPQQVQNNANQNQPGGNNPTGGQGGQNTNQQTPVNPLDSYSKMFDNPSTEGDAPPSFTLDPKTMDNVVKSQDFTKGIDPAVLQKAQAGDAASLFEVIQSVGRNSYRAAIEHGGMLTDKFVGAREAHSGKNVGSKVREELVSNSLSNTPNFSHPVVRKQLTEIATRFQKQHPDATPEEIANMSKKYLGDLMQAISPAKKDPAIERQEAEVRGEQYWDQYFDQDQPIS